MITNTINGAPISGAIFCDYFRSLINRFFKILPMRETEEASLPTYLSSLQMELLGFSHLVSGAKNNSSFMTMLSILQYLIDDPDCPVASVRREVFHAINLCNRIIEVYMESEAM